MKIGWAVRLMACFALGLPPGVMAQVGAAEAPFTRGTTINVFGGVASASGSEGAVFGGAAGWEVTPWIGLEAVGAWLDRPRDAEAFTAALSVHVNLLARRPAVPFVKGGFGLYRASFDAPDHMPSFYRRRQGVMPGPGSRTFTDPALVLGGGVNVFLNRHVALRPEVHGVLAFRDSRTHAMTAFTVHLAYHFEEHPVTPLR